MKSHIAWIVVLMLAWSPLAQAATTTFKTDHVTVNSTGITEAQAKSLGVVADAARKAAIDRFGFDVPEQITVNVDCKPGNTVRLFTDGNDTYTLSIRTGFDLSPPAASGIYNLYGMCHELGHVVMYRVIKDHRWMTGDAAESWAHYFGSQIVDDVYAAEGEKAWWMPYDYRADGMKRLQLQLGEAKVSDFARAAGLWMELAQIVGEKNMPTLFAAWGKAKIDFADPSPAVLAALQQTSKDPRVAEWWKTAEPVLIKSRPKSNFAPGAAATKPAVAKPTELASDDGKSKGKSSIAGSGHAVVFEAPGEGCKLTAVKIYGSRYGAAQPPAEDFHVYLCDSHGKQISEFPFPYKSFPYGGQRWVTLKLPEATEVPKDFIVCAAFNPTQTKGIFVHYDATSDGDSRTGLPGDLKEAFGKGDWMIRAVITTPAAEK